MIFNRHQRHRHNPDILKVYLVYRLLLGLLLYLMFTTEIANTVLGSHSPALFKWTSLFYTGISLGSLFVFKPQQLQYSLNRITFLLVIDLAALLLLIHASGGPDSGLGYLLLVCTAMASIFLRGQLALAFAALISLFIIGESIYITTAKSDLAKSMFAAGSLGILVFGTTIAFHYLTEKIRTSDEKAELQAQYAKNLHELARHIVTRMRTGIIVIDEQNKIELINSSALQMLDLPPEDNYLHRPLSEFSNLEQILDEWRVNPATGVTRHHHLRAGQEIKINFAVLDTAEESRTILYMEDYRALAQQAQQLKLASLGRLTASIAHEVRNPLGAISHAAQLLSESDSITNADVRLTEIIQQQSVRVNQIIENTLVLSRRKEPKPQKLALSEWLPKFITDFKAAKKSEVNLNLFKEEVQVQCDPTHLSQVLTNLCDNGIRYSEMATGKPSIQIRAGFSNNNDSPFIEVIDNGPGIDDDSINQVFDPFYTTDSKGSGLGLYISKELCEINQALLFYKRTDDNKSCFRINFSHNQRTI